ncbi:putative cell number regulator 2-like [Capsicum annuum]|nr:putative cell number regulator 2-like [Capsicum annuum]
MLTTNKTVKAIHLEKENLLKLIDQEQPPVAPPSLLSREIEQSVAEHHVVEEQNIEDDQLVQDQVQTTDSATPTIAEHYEAQGPSTRKTRGKTQMNKCTRIRESWRKNRRELKRDHYDQWENDEVRLLKRPKSVPECQFTELLVYWKSKKFQGSNEQLVDAFSAVMGAEHPRRVRLLGGRVTKTSLKRLNDGSGPSLNATNDVVQEMQEMMRKIEDQIEEQKRTIRQEVVADVIAQLQNAGILNPKILAALSVPSPMESTSTLAAIGRNSQNSQGDHDIEDGGGNEIDELDLT